MPWLMALFRKEDLSGLDKDGNQRKKSHVDQDVNAALQKYEDCCHDRSDQIETDDRQDHAQDSDGEVVDQHLETGGNLSLDRLIKFFDHKSAERADHHGTHQHGIIGCAADHTDAGDRAHDRASLSADHSAARIGDQDREHIGEHRADHSRQLIIGEPPGFDEQRRDQALRDKRADIRHDHST